MTPRRAPLVPFGVRAGFLRAVGAEAVCVIRAIR